MESKMLEDKGIEMKPSVSFLTSKEIEKIHYLSCHLLSSMGIVIPDEEIQNLLLEKGAKLSGGRLILPEHVVETSLEEAGKEFAIYGRSGEAVNFKRGNFIFCSSPGQFAWFDKSKARREATSKDLKEAIHVAHYLSNIDLVGGMATPQEWPPEHREILIAKELFIGTTKPVFLWYSGRKNFKTIFEMSTIVKGSSKEAIDKPCLFAFLEPISPLRFPREGLEILKEAASLKLPVMIGPMAQSALTAPATLSGTIIQENAEILAGIVIAQTLDPGMAICYGGIPHIMDPATATCSFGSPEQALLALAMCDVGNFYGFPTYINVGLTDSLFFDSQNGWEKGITLILGMLHGATTFGHMGIVGSDQGASIEQVILDDELIEYCKRICRGIIIHNEALDTNMIRKGVQEGSFLLLEETLSLFRKEFWFPRISVRGQFKEEKPSILEEAILRKGEILAKPSPLPEQNLVRELEEFALRKTKS